MVANKQGLFQVFFQISFIFNFWGNCPFKHVVDRTLTFIFCHLHLFTLIYTLIQGEQYVSFPENRTHNLFRWTRNTSLWFLIGCNVCLLSVVDFQSRIWCLNRIHMLCWMEFQSLCIAGKQLADFSGVAVETCCDGGCSAQLCLPDLYMYLAGFISLLSSLLLKSTKA